MNIFVDFDETICPDYTAKTEPLENAVETINALYEAGNTIKIWSCRTGPAGEGWQGKTVLQHIDIMRAYLDRWGVKYHDFVFNKPNCDVFIDDRSHNPKEVGWEAIGKKLLE
jgi:hypothetical protein